jgi:hypothetical protein
MLFILGNWDFLLENISDSSFLWNGSWVLRPNKQLIRRKNTVFWDLTPFGSCKNQRFRGMYCPHHQSGKNQRARRFLSPWWWRRYIPLKRRFI